MDDYQKKILQKQIDICDWELLEPHIEKAQSFIVAAELDFFSVAASIVSNDEKAIEKWIADQQLARPTPEGVTKWRTSPKLRFRMVVIAPFLLIQEVRDA